MMDNRTGIELIIGCSGEVEITSNEIFCTSKNKIKITKPSANTLMIVDDVDNIIVDNNSHYSTTKSEVTSEDILAMMTENWCTKKTRNNDCVIKKYEFNGNNCLNKTDCHITISNSRGDIINYANCAHIVCDVYIIDGDIIVHNLSTGDVKKYDARNNDNNYCEALERLSKQKIILPKKVAHNIFFDKQGFGGPMFINKLTTTGETNVNSIDSTLINSKIGLEIETKDQSNVKLENICSEANLKIFTTQNSTVKIDNLNCKYVCLICGNKSKISLGKVITDYDSNVMIDCGDESTVDIFTINKYHCITALTSSKAHLYIYSSTTNYMLVQSVGESNVFVQSATVESNNSIKIESSDQSLIHIGTSNNIDVDARNNSTICVESKIDSNQLIEIRGNNKAEINLKINNRSCDVEYEMYSKSKLEYDSSSIRSIKGYAENDKNVSNIFNLVK